MQLWRLPWLLATLVTVTLPLALGDVRAAAAPPPTDTAAPATIPVPEVARRAEEVGKLLRELDAFLVTAPMIDAIQRQLPETSAWIKSLSHDTVEQFDEGPSAVTLDGLTKQWQTTRAVLSGHVNVLGQRATQIEEGLDRLAHVREAWTRARTDARVSRAPAQVIGRIDGVLAAVATTASHMQAQRAATLVLQDAVARELAECEVMIDRIGTFYGGAASHLFERTGVPLWRAESLDAALAGLPGRVRDAAVNAAQRLRYFARTQRLMAAGLGALFIVTVLVLYAARRRTREWIAAGDTPPTAAAAFERPVSASLILVLAAAALLLAPTAPPVAVSVLQLVALVGALRVAIRFVPTRHVPALYMVAGFFAVDVLRRLTSVVPLLEQLIFLLEMVTAVAVLTLVLRHRPPTVNLAIALRLLLAVFVAALAAAAAGYTAVALLLGAGLVGSAYLALVTYAAVRVTGGLVGLALRMRPLAALAMVRNHRALVERRLLAILHLLGIGAWVIMTIRYLGLRGPALDLARAVVNAEVRRGNVSLSVGDGLAFAIVVAGTFLLSRLLRFVLEEEVYPRGASGRGVRYAMSGLLHYAFIISGFLLALATLGIDLTKITILAGAVGVGIGFGLQSIVNNIVSGLILLVERRIDLGDAIQIGTVAGRVQHMGMRACTVRTWEGAEVIVPNASLASENVANWTLSDGLRRIDVSVGVAYGTPLEKVAEILLAAGTAHKRVLLKPAPIVLFRGFGDSALQFEIRVWTDHFDTWLQTQSELAAAVHDALRGARIGIPVPQHDVRLRAPEGSSSAKAAPVAVVPH